MSAAARLARRAGDHCLLTVLLGVLIARASWQLRPGALTPDPPVETS